MTEGVPHARSLASITRGATLFMGGLVILNVAGFALNLVLTRTLGADGYGIYAYTLTVVGTVMLVTTLGAETSILRYIPAFEDRPRRQASALGLAYITTALCASAVAVGLYLAAPTINAQTVSHDTFAPALRLFAVVVVVGSMSRVITSTFRGLELLEYDVLTNKVVRPVTKLGCIGVAIGFGASIYGIMIGLVVASIIGCGVATYLLVTRVTVRPALRGVGLSRSGVVEYYRYSIPLTVSGANQFFKHRTDLLLLGFLLASSAVGIYSVALLLASALAVPLVALSQLFPPVVARLHSTAKTAELNAIYGIVTRWGFTASLLVAIVLGVYRTEFLGLFGAGFVAGEAVLVLLVVGQLVHSATGPTNYLLMMTGHQYVASGNTLFFGALNAVLTYTLINAFGLIGAGLATCFVLIALNLTSLAEIWYLERLFPYSIGFLKPLIAGAGAAAGMMAVRSVVDGPAILVLGTAIGVIVYLAIIVAIGIDATDKRFARRVLDERLAN